MWGWVCVIVMTFLQIWMEFPALFGPQPTKNYVRSGCGPGFCTRISFRQRRTRINRLERDPEFNSWIQTHLSVKCPQIGSNGFTSGFGFCFYQHILNSDQLTPVWCRAEGGKREQPFQRLLLGVPRAGGKFHRSVEPSFGQVPRGGRFRTPPPPQREGGHSVQRGAAPVVIGLDVLCHTWFGRVHSPTGPRRPRGASDTQVSSGGARPSLSEPAAFLGSLLF